MCDVICVTDRRACREDFLLRLRCIAEARPRAVILREKDLTPREYRALAQAVQPLLRAARVPLVLSGAPALARALGCAVQLPFAEAARGAGLRCGISVHAPEEAAALRGTDAAWLVAGHIWDTACKAGLPGRGLAFLRDTVRAAGGKPVYAIGGVTPERMRAVRQAGAAGACVMHALMTCPDPAAYLRRFQPDAADN